MKFTLFGNSEATITKSMQQFLNQAEWVKAAEQCEKLIKLYQPNNLSLKLKLAETYVKAGLRNKAIIQYQAVGEEYIQQGNKVKAISVYRSILNLDPRLPLIRIKLAELYVTSGERDAGWAQGIEAIKYLDSKRLNDQLINTLTFLAKLPFDDGEKIYSIGEMFRLRNQPEKAVDQFLNAAEYFLQKMEGQKAAQAFRQVLKVDPNNLEAQKGLELVQSLVKEQAKKAKAKMQETLYPKHELWSNFSEDRLDTILQKISTSDTKLNKEQLKEHYEMGLVYREMNLLDAAVEEFQLASQDQNMELVCYKMLKSCYEEKGMLRLAEELQQKISAGHSNPQ